LHRELLEKVCKNGKDKTCVTEGYHSSECNGCQICRGATRMEVEVWIVVTKVTKNGRRIP
jgi:hypothetical protein